MKTGILIFAASIASILLLAGQPQKEMNYRTQDNSAFTATITQSGTQLIDVRTPAEYAEGHIPGAVNMDIQSRDFDRRSSALDKSRPVAVYCRSGARSRSASERLSAQGYEVYNLGGGISQWTGPVAH